MLFKTAIRVSLVFLSFASEVGDNNALALTPLKQKQKWSSFCRNNQSLGQDEVIYVVLSNFLLCYGFLKEAFPQKMGFQLEIGIM